MTLLSKIGQELTKKKQKNKSKNNRVDTTIIESVVIDALTGEYEDLDDGFTDEKQSQKKIIRVEDYNPPMFNLKGIEEIYNPKRPDDLTRHIKNMSKILTFVKRVQHFRFNDACTIMPIATTNEFNVSLWGSVRTVSTKIKDMIEIGLISVCDSTFRHHAYYNDENRSRTYYYYIENERKFIDYCRKYKIQPYDEINNYEPIDQEVIKEIDAKLGINFDKSSIKFNSDLFLPKPSSLTKKEFKLKLKQALYDNYPELSYYEKLADIINERYYKDYPEFKIKFRPSFKWNSDFTAITGIGIRASNQLSSSSREDRPYLTTKYGLKYEKDVRSSIPRLTLSINTGEWVPESIDIYELVFKELYPNEEFTKEERDNIKNLVLRAYFEKSDGTFCRDVYNAMDEKIFTRATIDNILPEFRKILLEKIGGRTYDNEIFFVESCIYISLLQSLLIGGHKVWMLFDSWYSDNPLFEEENMYSLLIRTRFHFFYDQCKWLPHKN